MEIIQMANEMKLTNHDDLKIGENFDNGEHIFYTQDLEESNVVDALKWFENGKMVSIVSEVHGGIIGYAHQDNIEDIVSVLNLYAIDRLL